MKFKDHFSGHAAAYAKYRPRYPRELFAWLASLAAENQRAWDCATGSGQAAVCLSEFFEEVIATDASAEQIQNATHAAGVKYRVATAEKSLLESASVDLVTVAQALHWFDLDAFYAEAQRVLKPGGVVAVWQYTFLEVDLAVDAVINHFYQTIVGSYWPPERALVEKGLRNRPFPFEALAAPEFSMTTEWSPSDLLGYLRTWSASQRYLKAKDCDPVDLIEEDLQKAWGARANVRVVRWPLELRAGRPR